MKIGQAGRRGLESPSLKAGLGGPIELLMPWGHIRQHWVGVTHPQDIAGLKPAIGDMPIDILFSNPGIWGGKELEVDYALWEAAFRINTVGPYRMSATLHDSLDAANICLPFVRDREKILIRAGRLCRRKVALTSFHWLH